MRLATQHGLSIGLQLASGPWREALLLRVGHNFQRATNWHLRHPSEPLS
jgi:aspartyl-tRNA(Asn)/glutamyl-tRNA(Gln) amidotransferase subunit A